MPCSSDQRSKPGIQQAFLFFYSIHNPNIEQASEGFDIPNNLNPSLGIILYRVCQNRQNNLVIQTAPANLNTSAPTSPFLSIPPDREGGAPHGLTV
jgi:hypothetical protein